MVVISTSFYCAYKASPSGGPEDKTPPKIISNFPATDSVGITSLSYIEIEFSETIRKTTLPGNYWIIPELESDLEVKWKGNKKVRFYLNELLEEEQTYVFTLGTEVKDMRNNGLVGPFQIAFSSGDKLDQGSIKGQVFGDQVQTGVYINAYLLPSPVSEDSIIYQRPRYYTQIDKDGSFSLNYLQMASYRLIALFDGDFDGIYSMEADEIGLPFSDIQLDSLHPEFRNLNFYLIQEDTTGPRIIGVDTLPNWEIQIEFSEDILIDSNFTVEIFDSSRNETSQLLGSSYDPQLPSFMHCFLAPNGGNPELTLRLSGITDLAGNIPQKIPLSKVFTAPASQDTIMPKYLSSEPSHRGSDIPSYSPITINFDSPVDSSLFKQHFQLQDTLGQSISGRYGFQNFRKPTFTPLEPYENETIYEVLLNLEEMRDIWQRPFLDTLITIRFSSQSAGDLGEIKGQVFASDLDWHRALVIAEPLRGLKEYGDVVKKNETFQINYLPDGLYLMKAVLDVNENQQWDKGQTNPWMFAEPFFILPDTVKVRKRWTTEGINFNFEFRGTSD
jgi:hypothetical protein